MAAKTVPNSTKAQNPRTTHFHRSLRARVWAESKAVYGLNRPATTRTIPGMPNMMLAKAPSARIQGGGPFAALFTQPKKNPASANAPSRYRGIKNRHRICHLELRFCRVERIVSTPATSPAATSRDPLLLVTVIASLERLWWGENLRASSSCEPVSISLQRSYFTVTIFVRSGKLSGGYRLMSDRVSVPSPSSRMILNSGGLVHGPVSSAPRLVSHS